MEMGSSTFCQRTAGRSKEPGLYVLAQASGSLRFLQSGFGKSRRHDQLALRVNQYVWDALGRLTSVTQTSQYGGNSVAAKLATYQYDAASQLTDLRRYSSTSASSMYLEVHSRMGYDGAGRLQSLTHAKSEIASGQMWNGTSTLPTSLQGGKLLAGYFLGYD